jgi:hypothetical protein
MTQLQKRIRIKDTITKYSYFPVYNSGMTKNVTFFEIASKTSLLAVTRLTSDSLSDYAVFSNLQL